MKALRWITAGALIFAVSSVGCLRALKKGLANIAADEGPKHEVIVPEYKDYTSATTPFTLNYPVVPLKNATASKVLNQLIFEDVEATSIIVGALAADPNFAGAKFNGAVTHSSLNASYVGITYQINIEFPNGAFAALFQTYNYIIDKDNVDRPSTFGLFTRSTEAEDKITSVILEKITTDPGYDSSVGLTKEMISSLMLQLGGGIVESEDTSNDGTSGARFTVVLPGPVVGLAMAPRISIPLNQIPSELTPPILLNPAPFYCTETGDGGKGVCASSYEACSPLDEANLKKGCFSNYSAYCFSEKGEDAVYNCYTTEESCKELESKLDATYLGESCSRKWNADFNNPSGYSNN